MNIALILAGGVGKRAGAEIPKQFLEVNDIPVIIYTLLQFQKCNQVDAICVVSHHDWRESVCSYKKKYGITKLDWVVDGGRTGLESVYNGIKALDDISDDSIILIHDSVRPFITQKNIIDNIRIAKLHGVAVTSVPCVETLVKVDITGKSDIQIPRDNLMRVMTPQSFKLHILKSLFQGVDLLDTLYPSTFALYMSKGYPVFCSPGSERNIKITYPEDITYLKNLFSK